MDVFLKKHIHGKEKKLPTGEWQLTQNTTEIRIRYNSDGYIESMNKSREGLLEYKAKIPQYQKEKESLFPKKIQIEDYTGNNLWMMYIKELPCCIRQHEDT